MKTITEPFVFANNPNYDVAFELKPELRQKVVNYQLDNLESYFREHNNIYEPQGLNPEGLETEDIDAFDSFPEDYNKSAFIAKYKEPYSHLLQTSQSVSNKQKKTNRSRVDKEAKEQYDKYKKTFRCKSLRYLKQLLRETNHDDPYYADLLRKINDHKNACCKYYNPLMKEKHCRQVQKTMDGIRNSVFRVENPLDRCQKDDILSLYRVKPNPYMKHKKDDEYVLDIPSTLENFERQKRTCCPNWFYNKNPICKQIKQETKKLKAELRKQTSKKSKSRYWFGGKKTRRSNR